MAIVSILLAVAVAGCAVGAIWLLIRHRRAQERIRTIVGLLEDAAPTMAPWWGEQDYRGYIERAKRGEDLEGATQRIALSALVELKEMLEFYGENSPPPEPPRELYQSENGTPYYAISTSWPEADRGRWVRWTMWERHTDFGPHAREIPTPVLEEWLRPLSGWRIEYIKDLEVSGHPRSSSPSGVTSLSKAAQLADLTSGRRLTLRAEGRRGGISPRGAQAAPYEEKVRELTFDISEPHGELALIASPDTSYDLSPEWRDLLSDVDRRVAHQIGAEARKAFEADLNAKFMWLTLSLAASGEHDHQGMPYTADKVVVLWVIGTHLEAIAAPGPDRATLAGRSVLVHEVDRAREICAARNVARFTEAYDLYVHLTDLLARDAHRHDPRIPLLGPTP